ncbi:hypothetical protein [Duganella sp. Dugasp56]|uniref:hypothetical protein n=1 Tax=Duganella sp. Dugasp56 TaxID=3243046 RepID=UPI0039AFBF74
MMSKRAVFSLLEAATLLGCSVEDLLNKGGAKELRICAYIPDDMVVYSTITSLIKLADPTLNGMNRKMHLERIEGMSARVMHDVRMVVLSPSDCKAAVSLGRVSQSLFKAGVRLNGGDIPLLIEPPALTEFDTLLDILMFRSFACYPQNVDPNNWSTRDTVAPSRLTINTDLMGILRSDLPVEEAAPTAPIQPFDIGFCEEPYMPPRLITLYKTAMMHWDCSRTDWTQPRTEDVERSLREMGGYGKKLAEFGATLLRWSFRSWNQNHYEMRRSNGKLTAFDALVVVASAWRPGDGENQFAKYRDQAAAFELWESCDIKKYLAEFAWQIAVPEAARPPGRPKGKKGAA